MIKRSRNRIVKPLAPPCTHHDPMRVNRAQRVTVGPWGYNVLDPLSARSGLMRGLDGALYGMDYFSIVRITTNSVVMHLWPFYNYWNGQDPRAGVVQDGYHTFYGTTAQGGWPGGGIVFRLDLDTVFYPLTRATNGWNVMFLGLAGDTYRVLRAAS